MPGLRHLLLLALAALALGGCATAAQRRVVVEARERDVPFDLIVKMRTGDQLNLDDLAVLAQQRVPDEVVIDYLVLTQARYFIPDGLVAEMKTAGISRRMIDYLRSTPERFKELHRGTARGMAPRPMSRVPREARPSPGR
jgi:hypothetical protein